jgi:peptidoglycan/LPS O-acetylase OafA/YrhL
MTNTSPYAFKDTKAHYAILDGLRGVAALMVVIYHIFEGYAFAGGGIIESLNHGYLAVDFFFILSGFVVGYAYDDRLGKSMKTKDFLKRRLIRLHPMVIMGAVLGAATFCIQGSTQWDGTEISISLVMLSMLCAMLFILAIPGGCYEIRGNGEMFPLNGPSWSLFFEYIGNILYALFVRRLSTKQLTAIVVSLGIGYTAFAVFDASGYGNMGVGWTLDSINFLGGMLRMLFPFSMGLLLSRNFKPFKVKGSFWLASSILIIIFAIPYIPSDGNICYNGILEAVCVTLIFPILVRLGASGSTADHKSTAICNFLGRISYPLYMIHYPIMYLFYAWLIENKAPAFAKTWQAALGVYVTCIILALLCMKLYDEPVREYLAKKFLSRK